MAKIKYQHYVPKFYLDGFADINGMVWVYDKLQDKVFSSKPEGIGGENYFYDLPKLESSLGLDQPIEKAFWQHESEACKVIEFLDWAIFEDIFPPLHINNRQVLAMYMALQIVRTPKYREWVNETFEDAKNELLKHSDILYDEDGRTIHSLMFMDDNIINELAGLIADQIWLFARNETDSPFYSSDNPVLFKAKDNKFWTTLKKPSENGIQIIFPLSVDCLLYVMERTYWSAVEPYDGKISPVKFTNFMVEHENSGQVGMCKRFVFSYKNDFSFAREYIKVHPEAGVNQE